MKLGQVRPKALTAAALLAVDPSGLGGVWLRSGAGPQRDAWLAALRALLPESTPWLRLPLHIADERLLGGLDLTATLAAGRPVSQRGVLAQADGGFAIAAMAERLSAGTAARLAQVLDNGEVRAQRDGLALSSPARLALVALDEGLDDEALPASLADRLALHVDLDLAQGDEQAPPSAAEVASARERLARVQCPDEVLQALVAAAAAFGINSARASGFALHAARAAAALAGRDQVSAEDARVAVQCVLAPRATQCPQPQPQPQPQSESQAQAQAQAQDTEPSPAEPEPPAAPETAAQPDSADASAETTDEAPAQPEAALDEQLIDAVRAAMPAGLLALLQGGQARDRRAASAGRAGAMSASKQRGRPVGARRGEPRGGARLNLIETLRAAAPWQGLRRGLPGASAPAQAPQRVRVEKGDLHVTRFQQRRATTTVFVIDASGSAALHRLAEAKGAVELLLADCYARRDHVAVIGFRGSTAQLLLPPTRSLVRARRSLAGLPGGGGTPLAAGLDAARQLAELVRRGGATPLLVVLTDGRANIARDAQPGRERAQADALQAARALAGLGCAALLVDTSPQPSAAAQTLALAMNARYLALPYAAAQVVSNAVRAERR